MAGQNSPLKRAEAIAARVAREMGYEFVDVELVKEPVGRFLRFYVDCEGGISLNELESYHRAILPLMDDVDYDYMEVSSPGVDRPLKKPRDFERAAGQTVEVKTYRPIDGTKYFTGELIGLKEGKIEIIGADGQALSFEQKAVALCRPLVEFDEEDLMDDGPDAEE
ncbi:MAG: ribosome maturation factor RimP [Clostridia bacterium]|nr:ribosome maturation factor RimP [Clostridia bacterium]